MRASPDEEPLFNIGAVTRLTGVPVATLRAWEQRYGFPISARTPGGHRLYSERDVERIRWVKERLQSGMKTGQAIRMLQSLEREGRPGNRRPTTDDRRRAAIEDIGPVEPQSRPALDALSGRLLASLVVHDLEGASRLMGDMLAFYSPEELALGVMLPVLASIGEEWAEGSISVATEHLASSFLRRHLLMWLVTGPPARPVRPVVLACAPGEWHEGSLLMLGVLLRRRGWPVAYLGQAVPLPDLASFVRETGASVVVLAAMTGETARALLDWPAYLPEALATGAPVVGYGGAAYVRQPGLREKTLGLYLGDTLEEGVDAIEGLLLREEGRASEALRPAP